MLEYCAVTGRVNCRGPEVGWRPPLRATLGPGRLVMQGRRLHNRCAELAELRPYRASQDCAQLSGRVGAPHQKSLAEGCPPLLCRQRLVPGLLHAGTQLGQKGGRQAATRLLAAMLGLGRLPPTRRLWLLGLPSPAAQGPSIRNSQGLEALQHIPVKGGDKLILSRNRLAAGRSAAASTAAAATAAGAHLPRCACCCRAMLPSSCCRAARWEASAEGRLPAWRQEQLGEASPCDKRGAGHFEAAPNLARPSKADVAPPTLQLV